MATHSGILSWRIPIDRGAWQATVHGLAKKRTERLSTAQHSTMWSGWHKIGRSQQPEQNGVDEEPHIAPQ